jgi:hypothetical protein
VGGIERGITLFVKGIKKRMCHGDGGLVMYGFSNGGVSISNTYFLYLSRRCL